MARNLKRVCAVLFCTTLLLGMNSYAATEGVVKNSKGERLAGVTVLTNQSGVATQTDEEGKFSFANNAKLTRVTFSHVGYHPLQVEVGMLKSEIVLDETFFSGEPIYVRPDRARSEVSTIAFDNYSSEELKRDYLAGDLPLLLNTTPNYYSYSDGGGTLGYVYTQIRGFDDKRIATYIDGVPLNDPEDQYSYWVDLPDFSSSVTDVQIQRGVGNSLYGDASFGGSINIVTNTLGLGKSASITAGYGEFMSDGSQIGNTKRQTIQYSSGLIRGRYAFSARLSNQQTTGYRENSWVESQAYYFSAARLDPNMSTEFYVFGGPMTLRLTYYGISRDQIASNRRFNPFTYENEIDNFNQPHFHLHNKYHFNDQTTLSNTFYYVIGNGYYEQEKTGVLYTDYNIDSTISGGTTGDIIRQQSVSKWQLGWNPRLDIEHDKGRHSLGGSFYLFESDHSGTVVEAEGISGTLTPDHKYYQYYGNKKIASLYAEEQLALSDRLTMQGTAQVRYQRYAFDQDKLGAFKGFNYDLDWLFFSPRIGFNYKLIPFDETKQANLYGNLAMSSRTPTDAAIYDANDPNILPSLTLDTAALSASGGTEYLFGDATVKAERVYDIEFGGNIRAANYTIGVNLYWMDFQDEIIPYGGLNPSTGQIATVNAKGSNRRGIELSGKFIPTEKISLTGNFSLNRYVIKDFIDTLDVYYSDWSVGSEEVSFEGKNGLGFPKWLGNLIVDYNTGPLFVSFKFQSIGKQYMELLNLDSLAIDPYVISSLSASYSISNFLNMGELTISGSVDNLFDRKFERSGYGWNYGVADMAGDPVTLVGGAEYYVASERSFYTQISFRIF